MKWGQIIIQNTLWKWRTRYISYNVLKQIIKTLSTNNSEKTKQNASKLKSEFATIIDRDLSKVDSFFNYQQEILMKQYDILILHWNHSDNNKNHIIYCLTHSLNKLLIQLKELENYAFINAEGFRKIIKKYDKRLLSDTQSRYYPIFIKCNFYKHETLKNMMNEISNILNLNNENKDKMDDDMDGMNGMNEIENVMKSSQNEKISQLFIHAVRSNKYDTIQSIVKYYNNNDRDRNILKNMINSPGYLGNTSLMTCCAVSGSIKIANILIKYGADIKLKNSYCRNVLHIAAHKGHIDIIKMLINIIKEKNENENENENKYMLIHELDKDIHNALHLALLRKQYISCKLLIEFDSTIINQQNADGMTPLMIACNDNDNDNDNKQLIELLLKYHSSNINQRDFNLQTALHYACNSGNKLYVDILLKYNIDPFVFDLNGQSPIHLCAANGYLDILKKICSYCNDYYILNKSNKSNKCNKNEWKSPIPIFDHTDNAGRSALHLSAANGFKQCTDYLISIGVNTNIIDHNLCNPRSNAFYNGILNENQCPIQSLQVDNNNNNNINNKIQKRFNLNSDVSFIPSPSSSPILSPISLISNKKCIVKFRIQCQRTMNKQYLCIIGDCDELGNNDITRAVKMYENRMPISCDGGDEDCDESESENKYDTMSEEEDVTTWIAEIALPKGINIKYKYIVRNQSSLEFIEALPTERNVIVNESMIIDDGVFGVILRHKSYHKQLYELGHASHDDNFSNFDDSYINSINNIHESIVDTTNRTNIDRSMYIESGWLSSSDAQLQIRLGHIISNKKREALIINNNLYIDRIVIHSGYINTNRYRGIHININLPIKPEDKLKVYKFQGNAKNIYNLCSLEFEFFPRFGPSIAKVFVLPSQILSNNIGSLTLALLSSNHKHDGLLIGEFNFEYILIKPFIHRNCGNILRKTFQHIPEYNKSILIGHRGTGSHKSANYKTTGSFRRTHIKENTILAFNLAKSFGADFVEFDVQLTKDKVPIIYHDFLFPIKPFKIPINKITFNQLQEYNKQNQLKVDKNYNENNRAYTPPPPQKRQKTQKTQKTQKITQQITNISQFNNFLEDNICCLSEVFKLAPNTLGFNIEIKYPNYDECIIDGIENTVDINEYVDEILKVVFNHINQYKKRYIIFSSFHPDICIALALKQPQFPILFLTEGGYNKGVDIRCNSLKNAIKFAKIHHLFGIVTNVKAIINSPQLIDIVHKHGLILLTYGKENNDTKIIDLQMKYGIDGLISDHVQYIRSHLDSKHKNNDLL